MTHDAEERVRAYLDWEDDEGYVASIEDGNGERRTLELADLRAVLQALADTRQQLDKAQRRIAKLEGKARAIRSHCRVRMDILRDRQHENPRRKEIIAKIEQLTDLTACLDHLYDDPQPDPGPTRHGHDSPQTAQAPATAPHSTPTHTDATRHAEAPQNGAQGHDHRSRT